MERQSKFILMVIFEIPAIILSLLIFIYFIFNRPARSKVKNHGWIILLTNTFFQLILNLPMPMSYFYLNYIWPSTNAYCVWWTWCEYSLNAIGLYLMAWISIERHLLIFHEHTIFQVRWKKWIFHFLPIAFCVMWGPLFFLFVVVITPFCTNVWIFSLPLCGFPCYGGEKILHKFDFIFNILFPILIIMLANITLIIRVLYQKMSRQRVINWRRHLKMMLQLWIVSSLYMGFWLPLVITLFIEMTTQPLFMINQLETMQFAPYFVPLFLPMVCLTTQPELIRKIKNFIREMRPMNRVSVIAYNRNIGRTITINTAR
ncbi:unnamed protein product [Adineta steineri]|uniref:G-protein coupled receptors family 1 profile domain-containing protein n=1 Tax=Adineta steineri TaxID=433720 RepID=A0A816E371_9BILA|nr:unnamed protein product [Adineta steineri]CAF1644607.1 unnamed protein product [Adineta steineri]